MRRAEAALRRARAHRAAARREITDSEAELLVAEVCRGMAREIAPWLFREGGS